MTILIVLVENREKERGKRKEGVVDVYWFIGVEH